VGFLTHCLVVNSFPLLNIIIIIITFKASATQRAGRTGRVRPGSVYRLYSKELYAKFQEHEESEVLRRTLQDVVLRLWAMLETSANFDGVVPLLKVIHIYMYIFVCEYLYMYVYVYICLYIHTYIYVYIFMYIYTYIYGQC
jgi:hypothetical protein